MTCQASLIRPKDLKVLKVERINADTYPLCEVKVKNLNDKSVRKDEAYWTITNINI